MSRHHKGVYLLFFLSPIACLIYAMRNLANKHAKNVIWLLCGYLGYSIQITPEYKGDAVRYIEEFLKLGSEEGRVLATISNLFSDTANIEIVEKIISMFVSSFSDNYHVLYLFYGLFFGYFFSRNISYLYELTAVNKKKGLIWIIVALFFTLPPWGINGFNFWTASQIFIFAMLPYIIEKDKKRLLFIVLAPLTHFAFYVIIMISFCFFFFKKKNYKTFYILSFAFLFINFSPQLLGSLIVDFIPEVFMHKFKMYTELKVGQKKTGGRIFEFLQYIYVIGSTIIFLSIYNFNEVFIKKNKALFRLFHYGFFFMATINILSVIPSVARYFSIGNWVLWSAVGYLMILNKNLVESNRLRKLMFSSAPLIVLIASISIVRYLFPILGLGSFLSNPILSMFFTDDDFVLGNIVELF